MPRLQIDWPLTHGSGILSFPDVFYRLEQHGAVVGMWTTKTYTLSKRYGNENDTVCELEGGAGNRMGLPNPGLEKEVDGVKVPNQNALNEYRTPLKYPVNFSLGGFTIEEYVKGTTIIEKELPCREGCARIAAIELNGSCSNKVPGEQQTLSMLCYSPERVKELVSEVRKVTGKPLIFKLSPDCDVRRVAKAAEDGGADYIGVANTSAGMFLRKNGKFVLAGGGGGISGKMLKPRNLRATYEVYEAIDPAKTGIIGQGGIGCNLQDLLDYFRAGASICGFGTEAVMDVDTPDLAQSTRRLAESWKDWLKENDTTLDNVVGSSHPNRSKR